MSCLITMGQRQQMRAADEDVKVLIQQTHPQPMSARVGGRGAQAHKSSSPQIILWKLGFVLVPSDGTYV